MQHAFFRHLAFTGMRKGEALALTWNDIDTSLNELKINKALAQGIDFRLVIQSPKNHSSVRTLSIDDNTVKLLQRWQMKQRDDNLKKITIHGFRHTHCSLLFEAGRTIEEVKDRMGHSDIKTTMNIYTHVSKDVKDEVASNFAKYVNCWLIFTKRLIFKA